ncbi:MAG: 30S ribosomal protein S8, small subunit ribosomal protein S8 [archaeon GW2011_AR17]|nr:30S ribosomal protein S8, small subunit ribosomal protein S8 [uncultured archaeon]KHO52355.1 MAG: 30S ribosomal protein S8, small subunit ribosomal protein S8 [archaeon GW2011_AR17]MBS3154299.1 30S ribosomal protein S8 [Candidatus Woesearchaeota archaeon]HIH15239.1 30S ribosomal protein S8 [Nanoarchaeota archaeon]HIH58608.1 30S ribosomal protein S8 [Nanoarchaeota archaeon]
MAMNDTLAAALSNILNAEKVGKANVIVKPVSKITKAVLEIMKDNHYIGAYTIIDDGKGGFIEINLIGGVNKCGAIKPRFAATVKEYDKFEKRFLPSKDFGIIILSTSKGIMTQDQAKEQNLGGRLLAFVY